MRKNSRGNDMMNTPGFQTPVKVGNVVGDKYGSKPVATPGGPVADPLGVVPRSGGSRNPHGQLPSKR